jgi:mannose-6-phosphate isomerase-like protein (cupin superfamily)
MTREPRRIVTGHAADGKSVVAICDMVEPQPVAGGALEFFEIWNTTGAPTILDNGPDPTRRNLRLAPTSSGSVIRFVDFHPETQGAAVSEEEARAVFEALGAAGASSWRPDAPHPAMHRTETVDYGIVLEGEIYLILDETEVALQQGDVVVQRGTNHSWANRSDRTCRMAFILIDGRFAPELRSMR